MECSDPQRMNTVCGTIEHIFESDVQVMVDRKSACGGCRSSGVCHGFTKTRMELRLARPPFPMKPGDTVVIAMGGASLIKASAYAFLIPLIAIIAGLFTARALSDAVSLQAACGILAFSGSLVIVRYMGNSIERPRIIEVIHEE